MVVQCNQCRARFNAPDEFGGRKVRCRKCSAIIPVPYAKARAGGNGKDVLYADELEVLDDADFSQAGGGRTGQRGGPVGMDLVDPDLLFQQASAEFESPRSNALYYYPLSGHVDRWLPFLIALPGLIWLCTQAFTTASAAAMPGWVGPVRLLIILFGFIVFVLPASYGAVRFAARRLNFRMPPWTLWRVGATFSLPYVLAAAMWLIAGQTADLVTGLVVGLLMALPALWLLLRLDPQEGPLTLSLAGGAFVVSTSLVVGLVLLFASLTNAQADPANKPTALRENPIGPGLRWDRPPEKRPGAKAVVRNTTPVNPTPVTPTPGNAPTPTTTPAATAVAVVTPDMIVTAPAATRPITRDTGPAATNVAAAAPPASPWAPTTQGSPSSSTQPGVAAVPQPGVAAVPQPVPPVVPAVPQPPVPPDPLTVGNGVPLPELVSSVREGLVGRFIAVLGVPAPRSHVAVLTRSDAGLPVVTRWDMTDWRPAGEVTFSGQSPDYHLSSDGALVARLTGFPSLSVQVYSFLERKYLDPVKLDATQGEPNILGFAGPASLLIHWRRADDGSSGLEVVDATAGKWLKRIPKIGTFEPMPGHFAISDDGRLVALFTREPGSADAANVEIYSLGLNEKVAQRFPVTQLSWNRGVRATGVAVTTERDEVALLAENEGQGLFLAWEVATGKPTRQHLAPAGLVPAGVDLAAFQGNALNYLDGGRAWLVYGCSVYGTEKGQRLDTLGVTAPLRQWVSGDHCLIYRNNDRNVGVISDLRINAAKLRAMLEK